MYAIRSYYDPPQGDGWVSAEPELLVAIQTADCLPVLLCDREGTQVAALHAGWRGLNAGVITSYSIHYTKLYERNIPLRRRNSFLKDNNWCCSWKIKC